MTLSPKLGVVGISTLWHFRLPLPIQMFIKVASSPRLSGIGMPSPILWYHPLKMQRIVLLSSLLWWELGTNSLITGPGEWLSFRRFTSKLSWSWSWSSRGKLVISNFSPVILELNFILFYSGAKSKQPLWWARSTSVPGIDSWMLKLRFGGEAKNGGGSCTSSILKVYNNTCTTLLYKPAFTVMNNNNDLYLKSLHFINNEHISSVELLLWLND